MQCLVEFQVIAMLAAKGFANAIESLFEVVRSSVEIGFHLFSIF